MFDLSTLKGFRREVCLVLQSEKLAEGQDGQIKFSLPLEGRSFAIAHQRVTSLLSSGGQVVEKR